jgi:hypothetical protein
MSHLDKPFWQGKPIIHKDGKFIMAATFIFLRRIEFTVEDLFKLGNVDIIRDKNGIMTASDGRKNSEWYFIFRLHH